MRVLEKLTVTKLVKEFPAFCGSYFITGFTRACHGPNPEADESTLHVRTLFL